MGVVALKKRFSERVGDALRPEAAGSRWPKVTLGALREGRAPLSLEELTTLSKICLELSSHDLISDKWRWKYIHWFRLFRLAKPRKTHLQIRHSLARCCRQVGSRRRSKRICRTS